MNYYGGVWLLVLASFALGVGGLWHLASAKRWGKFASFVALICLWPLATAWVFRVEDDRLRLWVGMLVAASLPIWLMIGFFISHAGKRADTASYDDPKLRKRLAGFGLVALSISLWIYGAFTPSVDGTVELMVIIGVLYSAIYGLPLLFTGKTF